MGFAAAIWQRNVIRAHFWAWRLEHTDDLKERGNYIACLTSVGSDAMGAIGNLSRNSDPALRLLAVYPLQKSDDTRAMQILSRLLRDPALEVREATGLTLAFSSSKPSAEMLGAAVSEKNKDVAANAVAACARANPPLTDYLCVGLVHPEPFVRAQAIESLCELIMEDGENKNCRIEAIVDRLDENSSFEGMLSLELESQRAGGFLHTKGLKASQSPQTARTVSQIAAAQLSRLAHQTITPVPKVTPDLRTQIAEKVRNGIRQFHNALPRTASMPAIANQLPWATTQP